MALFVQQNNTESRNSLEIFASLDWLDGIISFVFRLLAKLAEPFLAAGLIMSAIDYMSHGSFLVGLWRASWIVTQGFALESSGGVVLALSFEAKAEGDMAKMWVQRVLAVALLLVGGILFFVEMAASVKGFNEGAMSDWYIYGMSGLRSVVSLAYLAVMRTKGHRFSGDAQSVPAQPSVQGLRSEIENIVSTKVKEVHDEVQGLRADLVAQLRTELRSLTPPQPTQKTMRTTTVTEVSEQAAIRRAATDPLMSVVSSEPSEDIRSRIHRFVLDIQSEQGRTPTLLEIQNGCECAKNTAIRYRKEVLELTQASQ